MKNEVSLKMSSRWGKKVATIIQTGAIRFDGHSSEFRNKIYEALREEPDKIIIDLSGVTEWCIRTWLVLMVADIHMFSLGKTIKVNVPPSENIRSGYNEHCDLIDGSYFKCTKFQTVA